VTPASNFTAVLIGGQNIMQVYGNTSAAHSILFYDTIFKPSTLLSGISVVNFWQMILAKSTEKFGRWQKIWPHIFSFLRGTSA
jgi:hypothetical protein